MKVLNTLLTILKKPFPTEEDPTKNIRTAALVGLFVIFFLYVFEPFDIDSVEQNKFLYCIGFGVITFLSSIFYEVCITRLFGLKSKPDNYTFGKWIIDMTGILITISIANFIFIRLVFFGYILWRYLPYSIHSTLLIGIFPIVTIGYLSLRKQERKYESIAEEVTQQHATPTATQNAEESKEILGIPIADIRYIEALQNYVKIGYKSPQGTIVDHTERLTLKSISQELVDTSILRCHRSFLVNNDAIVSATGNAQGLQLTLLDCDKIIPVSRSYVPRFRQK